MTLLMRDNPFFKKSLLVLFACTSLFLQAAEINTALTTTNTASRNVLVNTYSYSDFKVLQFKLAVLSQYSYMLISDKKALVIDPVRETDIYQKEAANQGATIKGVFLTHTHSDFVAGHTELSTRTTAPIYQSVASGAEYPFQGVTHNQQLPFGAVTLQFLETPGHTIDSISLAISRETKQNVPDVVFVGDTLFVGSMGRPELLDNTYSVAELAAKAFDSWEVVLSKLPNETRILPTHGGGPFCGTELREELSSTIGDERKNNSFLRDRNRNTFVSAILERLPPPPPHYKFTARMNRQGPSIVNWAAALPPKIFAKSPTLNQVDAVYLIDLRTEPEYAKGHIPNAINIGLHDRFEMWVGNIVPWGSTLILCGAEAELAEAIKRLYRIGYEAQGIIRHDEMLASQLLLVSNPRITPQILNKRIQDRTAPLIIDIRQPEEWFRQRINTVINIPLEQLSARASSKLNRNDPVVIVCKTDYRSSIAIGLMERQGFKQVITMLGGIDAWIQAGFPVIQMQSLGSIAQPKRAKQKIRIPECIDPPALRRLLLDQPYPFELIDIRNEEQFADYSIPSARNIPFDELLADPVLLNGTAPLILIDRDGSLAMAIGGILSQKTERPVRVLYGGLTAYWEYDVNTTSSLRVPNPSPDKARKTSEPTEAAPIKQLPSQPKKRSAGC